MMGTHHALCGAAAWVAVTSTAAGIPALGLVPLDPTHVVAGAILSAGAALLPDADHPSATIAHAVPITGKLATRAVSQLSGGHRHGTHSLVAAAAVVFLAWGMLALDWSGAGRGDPRTLVSAAIGAALLAFAIRVLKIVRRWPAAWALGIAGAAAITVLVPSQWAWLGLSIAIGWIAHLAGDLLTTGGLPLLWPLTPRAPRWVRRVPVLRRVWLRGGNIALPVLGNTGSWREWLLLVPIGVYAVAGISVNAVAISGQVAAALTASH